MNEDKPEKPVTEQPAPAQPTTDPATVENSANTADQPEAFSSEAAAQASLGQQALQSVESAASQVEEPKVTSDAPLIAKPEAEQPDLTEAVPVGESAAGAIEQPSDSGPSLDKPVVDDAVVQQLFVGFMEGKKPPRLDQKKLAKLLKKVVDILNESGELPKRFSFGARDILAESAASRMLAQGVNRAQLEKAFVQAGINLTGVQVQIASYAEQTQGQPLTIVDALSVKRAKQADAFCGFYPWC